MARMLLLHWLMMMLWVGVGLMRTRLLNIIEHHRRSHAATTRDPIEARALVVRPVHDTRRPGRS